jgi:pimeloyl-ACP methyl ester carboxylesterase
MQETAVLVHGVLMTGRVMAVLARRLRGCGYRTRLFDYPTRRYSLRENAQSLLRFVERLDADRVHLVGHSMGGVLILRALQDSTGLPQGRVVLMGAPVRGSAVAKRLCLYGPGRWLLGASAEGGLLEAVPDWTYGREIGVIAGARPVGLGMTLGSLTGRHDGTVGVTETCLQGATDTLVVNTSHTSLVLSRRVAIQVCNFLRQGRFAMPSPVV